MRAQDQDFEDEDKGKALTWSKILIMKTGKWQPPLCWFSLNVQTPITTALKWTLGLKEGNKKRPDLEQALQVIGSQTDF